MKRLSHDPAVRRISPHGENTQTGNTLFRWAFPYSLPLSIILALAMGATGCSPQGPPPDATGTIDVELTPRTSLPFPDTDAGRAVASHLEVLFTTGPDAEANYQASLTALRARGNEAISTIVSTYNDADKSLYWERALLVETLTELRMSDALDSLLAIANETLPERVAAPDDTISAVEQEVVIRMTAIRGLGHLAVRDDAAVGALAELAKHRELSINEQAKQSLAIVIAQEKDRERLQQLIEIFPGNYQHWVPLQGVAPPAPSN